MNKKKIRSSLYMESKIKWEKHELKVIQDPNGYLFAQGIYRTKILPCDLPEWYVYGYLYKQHGYISAKGVKHLIYTPNYFIENHLYKYDTLYISYNEKIEPYTGEYGFTWHKGYNDAIGGSLIASFVEAVGKFSDYDVSEIQKEIERKRVWYYEKNPKN